MLQSALIRPSIRGVSSFARVKGVARATVLKGVATTTLATPFATTFPFATAALAATPEPYRLRAAA